MRSIRNPMRKLWLLAAACLALVGLPLATVMHAAAQPGVTVPAGTCGTKPASSAHYTHVLWLWMENHTYSDIIGSADAPYLNALAHRCGLATNYHNITHLSLPNYISATSGLSIPAIQKFVGDCNPSASCSTAAASIFGQGESWKAYEVSMPANCDRTDAGLYAVRHNPPVYFTGLAGCSTRDVPYSQLGPDLGGGRLPAFSFVTPNLIDDMHNGTVAQGDGWLAQNLPLIFKSGAYTSGSLAVIVTFDEGEIGSSFNCPTNTVDPGCHVATIVASPTTRAGMTSGTLFNHWSLLRTTEEMLKLPLLGEATKAPSMRSAFGL